MMILDGVMNVILVCGVYWMTVYQVYVGVLGMLSWGGDWLYNWRLVSNMVESKWTQCNTTIN